jgi:hypothetical protein
MMYVSPSGIDMSFSRLKREAKMCKYYCVVGDAGQKVSEPFPD